MCVDFNSERVGFNHDINIKKNKTGLQRGVNSKQRFPLGVLLLSGCRCGLLWGVDFSTFICIN